ncbi:uncharacterized protein Dvar_03850 [Desulfosarcina variabilis str. Montpellier]|uniref:carboxypeptidase-like regulatory domain-containing protein n=1 Tax=Desulfosarcina variabilis TaxID=2300 RepID=UPI003AFA8644
MNYAFSEDHESILYSKAVLEQFNTIINNIDAKTGGYLKIHFSYDHTFKGERPDLGLILQPIGKKGAEMAIRLSANDNGRRLGPFPAGDYLATVGALTAIGNRLPVTIEDKATSALKYVLTPDHVIYGTLISALQSKDWSAGMPYHENFTIQSITLSGSGIHRKLDLLDGEDVNILDYLIPRTDSYYKGNFVFYGLPVGEFELIIRAQGYKPFVKKCFIKTGKQSDPIIAELTPE